MTLALVGYYEAWWVQILKAIVIFAVGLQLVPVFRFRQHHTGGEGAQR